jgi:hypothetical protein
MLLFSHMFSQLLVLSSSLYEQTRPNSGPYSLLHLDKAVQSYPASQRQSLSSVMPHGSKYGSSVVIVQERQYRPSSTYTVGSSASRSSGTSGGYYTSTMDSSSSSRSSSASNQAPDRTGTYRTGGSGMSITVRMSSTIDTNTLPKDGHVTTATHNTKGKREVVIVHHNTKHSDPAAPRSSDRYRS